MTKIFYKTTADFNNTGEVLIYKTLLENLRKYGNVIIDDSPHIQPLFLERIGIREEERLHRYTDCSFINYIIISALKNLFKREPLYFATGVGDHAVNGVKGAIKNIGAFLFILIIRLCGVKVLRIGMSIKFNGFFARLSERLLGFVVSNYYVRDSVSWNNCKKAGVNVGIAPDLSWGYQVENHNCSNKQSKWVILSFRDYVNKNNPEPYKTDLYKAIDIIVRHISKDKTYNIIMTYQCDYDKHVMEEIMEKFGDIENISIANELVTLQNAEEYYGKTSMIITNRLHVLLLGYKYGALTIGLTDLKKHVKIQGIFADNDLSTHLIDINQPSDDIISAYDYLRSNIDAEWMAIHNAETKNHNRLDDVFQKVFM